MTNDIELSSFIDNGDLLEATAKIWGQEAIVFLDGDELDTELKEQSTIKQITKHLEWLSQNKKQVIDFALDSEGFIDAFNDWVESEINRAGKAKLYDGHILISTITYDEIYQSVAISSITVGLNDIWLSVDLTTQPDYFGGHLYNVEIDKEFNLLFGGVNG